MAHPAPSQDRPLLGVFLMIGFALIAPGMDALAKLASEAIPVGQILAFRFGVQTLLLFPLAWALGLIAPQGARALGWHLVRAFLILAATGFFFSALRFMPLADAIAIFFVEPFILTLFGAAFLGERIGWRRLMACAVGFAGAMLVIRPSFSAFGPVALLPLGTAVSFALYMVLNRRSARDQHPVAMQAWTGLAASALILPLLLIFAGRGGPPLDPVMPEGRFWLYLAGIGLVASASHLCVSSALRFAPAATVAPLQYLEIIAAALLGYWIFADLPDTQTVLGIAVIVASGLFVIWRENKAPDAAPRPATRAAPGG